jgi:hypothetical protein
MSWQQIVVLPVIGLILVAMGVWLVAAYSFFVMLGHVKGGRWFALIWTFGWWLPSRAPDYIEPAGLPHHGRLMKAILIFIALILCAMVYMFAVLI